MNKILPILLIIGGVSGFANAQRTRLYPEGGRAEASKVFRPKTQKDSDLYDVYLRKYQEVSIKVISSSVFITRGNECGMYFRLFDDKGEETKIGDSPAGVDDWSGYVEHAGIYHLRIRMGCLEAFTAKQFAAKKPKFTYTLKIFQPLALSS